MCGAMGMDAPRARGCIGVQRGDSAGSWSRGSNRTNPGIAGTGADDDACRKASMEVRRNGERMKGSLWVIKILNHA